MLKSHKTFILKVLQKNTVKIKYDKNKNKNLVKNSVLPNILTSNKYLIVTAVIIRKSFSYSYKRNMYTLTRMRNLLYRGHINKNATHSVEHPNKVINRNHTNWTGCVRVEESKYDKNPPLMEIDPETGLEIMRAYDASGKNHILLINEEFKHDRFYMVSGSFTTSSTFYENIAPEMVAGFTLEGSVKPQFLQKYVKPRLIKKTDVIMHTEATATLQSPEYASYLNALPSKTNYP